MGGLQQRMLGGEGGGRMMWTSEEVINGSWMDLLTEGKTAEQRLLHRFINKCVGLVAPPPVPPPSCRPPCHHLSALIPPSSGYKYLSQPVLSRSPASLLSPCLLAHLNDIILLRPLNLFTGLTPITFRNYSAPELRLDLSVSHLLCSENRSLA